MCEQIRKCFQTHEFSICGLDESSSIRANSDSSEAVSITGEDAIRDSVQT